MSMSPTCSAAGRGCCRTWEVDGGAEPVTMPTTDCIGRSRSRRPGRQALAVALLLLAVPACTNLENAGSGVGNLSAIFQGNPYEQTTLDRWMHGDRTKGDVTLPGKENPARTA